MSFKHPMMNHSTPILALLAFSLSATTASTHADSNAPDAHPTVVNAKPYSLQQAIAVALEQNPNIQMTHERIHQAEAQLGIAKSAFYPQVNTRLSYEYSDNPSRAFGMIISQRRLNMNTMDFNHPGGVSNYRPEVTATMSLFNGGQDAAMKKAAELGVTSAALQESAMRNQLIEAVTSAYYGILAAEEAHKVAERAIEAVTGELKQSQIRYDAGTLLKSDLLSLKTQLAEAQDAEIQTQNAIELARTSLKTLLGLDLQEELKIVEASVSALPATVAPITTLIDQALQQRPEMQAAALKVSIAEQQLKAAQGAYLPKANAYVGYGSDSQNLAYSTSRDNVTVGVAVEVNVFAGFAHSEQINKAQSQFNEAQLAVKQIQLEIENQVKSAQLQLSSAMARLNVTTSAVAQAEEALRLVNEQRQAGTETVTRYLTTEAARDQAHSRVIAARYDALQAEAQLNQALGAWK